MVSFRVVSLKSGYDWYYTIEVTEGKNLPPTTYGTFENLSAAKSEVLKIEGHLKNWDQNVHGA